jgi:hypothetical protein
MRIEVEIIEDLLLLEPGDIIMYATNKGLYTAKIDKKPAKHPKYLNFFKPTRCKVNADHHTQVHKGYAGRKDYITKWTVQNFHLEEFNTVKYVTLSQSKKILRVLKK